MIVIMLGLNAIILSAILCGVFCAMTLAIYCFRKQQKKLDVENAFLRDVFYAYAYGLILFDSHGVLSLANKKARTYLPGIFSSKEAMTLEKFLMFLHDNAQEHDEHLIPALQRMSFGEEAFEFREVVGWDGGLCLVEAHRVEGTEQKTIFILRDFDALRKSQEEFTKLNRYSHKLNQAVEVATNGIVIVSKETPDIPIISGNKAFCDFVGVARDEVEGRSFSALCDAVFAEEESQEILKLLVSSESIDVDLKTKDPKYPKYLNLKFSPVVKGQGEPMHFIGVFTDTTELRQREKEFFEAQKLEALGQLAAGVAHDFNNILSIVDGYARMVTRSVEDNSEISEYAEKIRMASHRGADLIKKMLTFSRHKIVERNVINLSEIVRETESLLRPLLEASINLDVRVRGDDCFIEASPDDITQILMNLTVNARDAIPQNGLIRIESHLCEPDELPEKLRETQENAASAAQRYACLSVTDDGQGISKEVREKIFDPFFTTKESGKGTGLGLSMIYGLVNEMNGYIDMQSEEGWGTIMSIYLPLTDKEPDKLIYGSPDDLKGLSLKGYTVLIAEDEPDLLTLVADMLSELGMNVIKASNGDEALVFQDDFEGAIDVLVTDIVMPGLNGLRLAEMFSEIRPKTKVIFMSGYPAGSAEHQGELPENVGFIAKPVKYEPLARLIYQSLSNKNETLETVSTGRWAYDESRETIRGGG